MVFRFAFALALLVSATTFASVAHANGILLSGNGLQTPKDAGPVVLRSHDVKATINDTIADVTVSQTFFNNSADQLEGTYVFPLPEGAVVRRFAMTMSGKMVEGEVVEAKQAKRIYEGIVRRRQDPGLLEYLSGGLFRARVFPIEGRKPLTIELSFQLVLRDDAGTLELRYPLAAGRMHGASVGGVSIAVNVKSTVDLKAIYSPSHRIEVVRDGERAAKISYESRSQPQARDFLLYVARSPETVGFSVISHKAAGEDGTFMAVLAPPQRADDAERVPKDVVFVLDTSGSMEGPKIDQARKALAYGVRTLKPGDRFNVLSFSTTVRPFRDGLLDATEEVREAAVAWIEALGARGGTNMEAALEAALRSRREDRALSVVFLTDGRPSVGAQDAYSLLRTIERAGAQSRIYTFGVGHDLDVNLLDRIAEATHGTRDYVAPGEDIEVVTGRFFRKVQEPVFTNVRLDLGAGVYDVYPAKIGDLFAGSQVVVFGRYRTAGERTIGLAGTLGRRKTTLARKITLAADGGFEDLQRLWANRKVAYLIDHMRLNGRHVELVEEVVALATRHQIVTPYTSGLVVEEYEESFGESEGLSDGPFEGPSTNGVIGIGGGAGGAFKGRGGGRDLGTGGGGRKKTEDAVDAGLRWLNAHQSADGGWKSDGKPDNNVGVSGLALMAFLGAGYTNRGKHDFARSVGMGLRYLKNVQDANGRFGKGVGHSALRQHIWATLAMVEAYAMTGSPIFKGSAARALRFVYGARNPAGVWDDPDVTTWMAYVCLSCSVHNHDMARAGRLPSLPLPQDLVPAMRTWARGASEDRRLVVQALLGAEPLTSDGAAQLAKALPTWDPGTGTIDVARWHHGTYAIFQAGGRAWDRWKKGIEAAVVASQRQDTKFGDARGSWDPHGPWAGEGGRVYMTALMTRSLEVFYAYDRDAGRRATAHPRIDFDKMTDAEKAAHSKRLREMKESADAIPPAGR